MAKQCENEKHLLVMFMYTRHVFSLCTRKDGISFWMDYITQH